MKEGVRLSYTATRPKASANEKWQSNAVLTDDMKKQFAFCIDDGGCPASLERRKVYEVVPDSDARKLGLIRVVDESGEDYLFSQTQFVLIKLPLAAQHAL